MDADDPRPSPAKSFSAFGHPPSSDPLPYGTGSDNSTECDEEGDYSGLDCSREAPCIRTTFFVNADWRMGSTLANATNIVGQMYVEQLDPIEKLHPYPIVLIHGDFHTGQMAKPDGNPGWASYFIRQGFQVYVVDLPPCGRSNFLTGAHFVHRELGRKSRSLAAAFIENELTAAGKYPAYGQPLVPLKHPRAALHNQWPGTGQRGDPVFTNYCASLVTLHLNKIERQSLGQNALQALLHKIGKSILIGEGSGGNMTWLATDVAPELVAGVVAVEPAGPPFGTAMPKNNKPRVYSQFIERDESTRPYGLTDIPLTYDPPAHPHEGIDPPAKDLLDIDRSLRPDHLGACFMQRRPETDVVEVGADGKPVSGGQIGQVRQLIHLKKVPHALVTAHASPHSVFDWATVAFMKQAGVAVDWLRLEDHRIMGNGHLMFLEMNSDEVAGMIETWIQAKVPEIPDVGPAGPITPAKSQNMRASEKGIDTKSRQGSNGKASERSFQGHLSTGPVRSYELAPRLHPTGDQNTSAKTQTSTSACTMDMAEVKPKRPAAPSSTASEVPDGKSTRPVSPKPHDQKRRCLGQGGEAPLMPMSSPSKPFPVPQLTSQQHMRAYQNLQGRSHGRISPQPVTDISLPPISDSSGPSQLRKQFEAITRADQSSPYRGPLARPVTAMPSTPQGPGLYTHLSGGTTPVEHSSAPATISTTESERPRTLPSVFRHITFSDESIRALANEASPKMTVTSDPTSRTSRQQFDIAGQPQMSTPLLDPRLAHISTPVDQQAIHGLSNSPLTPSAQMPMSSGYLSGGFHAMHAMTPPSPSPAPRVSVNQMLPQVRPIPPKDKKSPLQ
ncbi:hypothetical protein QQZ08_002239 [Neonectria magnoliae]|uniref:AB hydrolase-1 domain-containing protein n=1 Tax=Neonectria magnoliae TaxID=2732573 RepID=A0ABR1ICD7_9HYPO